MTTIGFHNRIYRIRRVCAGLILILFMSNILPAQELTPAEQQYAEQTAFIGKHLESNGYLPTTVHGRAVLPDGSPAVGFKIGGWDRSLTDQSQGFDHFNTLTDENGRFTLHVYRPFAIWVCITDPDRVYTAFDQYLELTEQPEGETILFQLQKGVPVEGIVIDRETNKPVAGLPVFLNHDPKFISYGDFLNELGTDGFYEWEKHWQSIKETRTDENGRFRFSCLSLNYLVSFNMCHGCFRMLPQEEIDLYSRLITVEDSPISLTLEIPSPWHGQLLQKDGTPAASYPITLSFTDGFVNCVTDQEGYFLVYKSPELKEVVVDTFSQGQWFDRVYDEVQLPDNTVFQLSSPVTTKGKIIRQSTGKPMENFKFACQPRPYHREFITTDENGDFEIPRMFLNSEAALIYLNEPDNFDGCIVYKKFKIFTPDKPDAVYDLGTIALEESAWLDPNALSLAAQPLEIVGYTLNDERLDWEKYGNDKTILVDFWASWCGPCLKEIPRLKELYAKYHDRGFEIIGISIDEDLDALEKATGQYEFPWQILADEKLKQHGEQTMADRLGISSIPRGILIRRGMVFAVDIRGDDLENELRRYYGED